MSSATINTCTEARGITDSLSSFMTSVTAASPGTASTIMITVVLVALIIVPITALWVLQTMHSSVGIAAPSKRQLIEESAARKEHPLFRYYPQLANRIAWRALGKFPTPLHSCECQAIPISKPAADKGNITSGGTPPVVPRTVRFYVKREDLSSSLYGGNKVRTLQHQLAVLESKLEKQQQQNDENDQPNKNRILRVFGSGGSNQVLATAIYALRMKLPLDQIQALWIADPPDLDNALNMLSTLSLESNDDSGSNLSQQQEDHRLINRTDITFETWGKPFGLLRSLLSACISTVVDPNNSFILTLGGNNPTGVLGQISGALELAEQVQQGQLGGTGTERRRVDGIYVAVGSSCTITGLILGVAIARRLGLDAFGKGHGNDSGKTDDNDVFRLHMVPIEDTLAMLHRWTGLYTTAKFARFIPLTIRHSLHATCKVLVELGGPDVLEDALAILEEETVVHANADLIGTYGAHSKASKACARLFDDTAVLKDNLSGTTTSTDSVQEAPGLWLCGHFTAKPMAVLCDHLLKADDENNNTTPSSNKTMIFWQTKSAVQPRGTKDEWSTLQNEMPAAVQEWANQGEAQSTKRPGSIDLVNGSPEDYRHLMTKIT